MSRLSIDQNQAAVFQTQGLFQGLAEIDHSCRRWTDVFQICSSASVCCRLHLGFAFLTFESTRYFGVINDLHKFTYHLLPMIQATAAIPPVTQHLIDQCSNQEPCIVAPVAEEEFHCGLSRLDHIAAILSYRG